MLQWWARAFRDAAPMTAAEAARVILDGVREERWRILVGHDAGVLDGMVRETPEEAYEPSFMERFVAQAGWKMGLDAAWRRVVVAAWPSWPPG